MKAFRLTLASLVLFSVPFSVAFALPTGAMFGGYVTSFIPCTCSVGEMIVYSPFYSGLPVPSVSSALYFQVPLSIPLEYFDVGAPTSFELGIYDPAPGVAQSACLVGIPPACVPVTVPVPVLGTIQYMGMSLPGASPDGSF